MIQEHNLLKLDYDARRKKYLAVCTCWHKVTIEPSALIGKTRSEQHALANVALHEEHRLGG